MRSVVRWGLTALLATVVAASAVSAQTNLGSMRGTVKDAQGVIPGATVQMVNEDNGAVRETVTNEVGDFSFPAVQPGPYTIKASVTGYKAFERKGFRVATSQAVSLEIPLEVGGIAETITVTGEAPLIETASASTGNVMDQDELQAIPTATRNVLMLAALEPTVQQLGNVRYNRMQDQSTVGSVSMGGGPSGRNNYLVEGFPTTNISNNSTAAPTMEALDEMKVQVHTYDAEMGRTSGGLFNMTAKAGANIYAGSAYTVLRPKALATQFYMDELRGKEKIVEMWHNFGGGIGGPIIKNKTFFWFAGERYTQEQPGTRSILVPTMAERNGDFSGLTRNGVRRVIINPWTKQPFPNNIIPQSLINPVGKKYASYFDTPDTDVDNGSYNLNITATAPSEARQMTIKANHNFSNSVVLSGFYLDQKTSEQDFMAKKTDIFAADNYDVQRRVKMFVANNTYILNDSTVLTVRYGFTQFDDNWKWPTSGDFDGASLWAGTGSPWPGMAPDINRLPTIWFSGSDYKCMGWWDASTSKDVQQGFNGTLSKLAGSHSIKMGGDYRRLSNNYQSYDAAAGDFSFNDNNAVGSGNAIADLLLGVPASGSSSIMPFVRGYMDYYAAYVQDDWRVNDKFTLNYGVRFEKETGLREKDNQLIVDFAKTTVSPLNSQVNVINPVTKERVTLMGGPVYAGVNGAATEHGNQPAIKVSPRVGMVYSLSDKTVLRGGWGIFYGPATTSTTTSPMGYAQTTSLTQAESGVPTISLTNPFPNGLLQPVGNSLGLLGGAGQNVTYIDPLRDAALSQQYSMDLQHELPGNMSLTLGYTGLKGMNLDWNTSFNINQIDPKYMNVAGLNTTTQVANPFYGIAASGGLATRRTVSIGQLIRPYPQFYNVAMNQAMGSRALYNAGVIQLRKRATGWWGANVSYTYSRSYDNRIGSTSTAFSSVPALMNNYTYIPGSSYYNPDADYARSVNDTPHKIVIAPTFMLPFGQGKKFMSEGKIADLLLGGWSITPVMTFSSGFPMGVSQRDPLGTSFLLGGTMRPNLVPGQEFLVGGDLGDRITASLGTKPGNMYYNEAAFSLAPYNTYGNAPRVLPGVYSLWRKNVDLSVSKSFNTGGRTRASLSMDAINLLNIIQWKPPASSQFGNSSFGQVTDQLNFMRMVNINLRFTF